MLLNALIIGSLPSLYPLAICCPVNENRRQSFDSTFDIFVYGSVQFGERPMSHHLLGYVIYVNI